MATINNAGELQAEVKESGSGSKLLLLMGAAFFFSGFSSLIYEVVWMRRLSLFFGCDVYSSALTLSSFMGGLTLGSLLAARYSDHLKKPLVWYGLLEIAIGLYALFFPTLLNMFSGEYRRIYQISFSAAPWLFNSFRMMVASVTLLIPATMMGLTLPLVVRIFAQQRRIGECSGFFYSINTSGALAGVLCVGFVLLPNFGIRNTTRLACCISVIIGLLVLSLGLFRRAQPAVPERPTGNSPGSETIGPRPDPALARAGLLGIGLSGLAALALEVVWMRILTQSFSGAVYSFSIMLSCFLFGICFGSKKAGDVIDTLGADPMRLFGFLELSIGLTVALLGILTCFVPRFFNNLLWSLASISTGHFGLACTSAEFAVSGLLIVIPTILMGAVFPVAVKICTPTIDSFGRGTGRVCAANTAGALLGSLLGGLVLLPAFGSRASLSIIAAIFTMTGLSLLYRAANRGWAALGEPRIVIIVVLSAAFVIAALLLPRRIVTNFYYAGGEKAGVIYHGEGVAHTIDIIKTDHNVTIMQVNGTLEADTTYSQRRHFILKALLPLLLHPDPREVAVVGLGLGITLSAINRHPGLERIQLIELSPEAVKAQSRLEDVSGGVLRSPKVSLRIDDGRNFMAMSNQQFDVITADPIHPRVSGAGYLYTQEYYEALKQRLRPDGVVCQWMPMYRVSNKSFDVAFRTFVRVFPNASFWYVRGHGLFVAAQGNFGIDYKDLKRRIEVPAVKADLASIGIDGAAQFMSYMLMGPDQVRAYLGAFPGPVNTDDNAYLEYHTPSEFLESSKTIVAGLISYAALDSSMIRNASDDERNRLAREWALREAQLMPEFDAKLDE